MNTKNAVLTTLLLFFITLEVLIALDYESKQKELNQKRVAIYTEINELKSQIGFVGLIDNFKNAILRAEDSLYIDKASENLRVATIQLYKIELQGGLILGELKMPGTRDMLTAYRERLTLLPSLLDKNTNVRELGSYLSYDDEPSHLEIEAIYQKLSALFASQLSDLLDRSLKLGLLVMVALLLTLVAIIRFFFKKQQAALELSKALNVKMESHEIDMARSQAILLSVMQDVEKEKRQATTLNKKLINKNKQMEQFIYTVSHDLKSPLVTIAAFSQKLQAELVDTLTEKQSYRLNRIIQNADNMELLLADLLDLSRIVQQAITTTNVNVNVVIEQQCLALEEAIGEANARINVAKNLDPVSANERLLSEVILNLLSNALRYLEPARPLIIEIFTTKTSSATTLHIKDNGIGIDPKYHQLIFDLFERLSTTKGSGVGLTIVKTIMDKHKGRVLIESQLGEGCCVSVKFPNVEQNTNTNTN
ncbi:hypothetical protein H4J51_01505 [Colwellia sp. MB02u-18]|uniref:sensor histidine kinase n=1 Tax=unclassified Colwellia TaxID=196834 RepID=UPI0015F485E7|nr:MULTISPECIES: ATP-binding protein [unclassified Colwellia]MBA6225393.1 hypothetical protein [Colwellia sp. MB3u-45]MBA6266611.1 hypothetical protein [Colwellia sp. MB3u-43]MBA6320740.1 hypothetical protein [Colwellia sp. MB02u-19]MBA6323255.1 hypothetical protein [Colwellia sp. MB02u-18]MBA6329657.1 hypothetical protein [Colwellia sp. MB02u-12]